MKRLHIIPLDDRKEHHVSTDCWCEPVPEDLDCDRVFFHAARDGRQLIEAYPGAGLSKLPCGEFYEDGNGGLV